MKKQILSLSLGLITIGSFAQKKELKEAEKALKKNNYTGVLTAIKSVDGIIKDADEKYKAKYYFLKAEALAGQKKIAESADAYNQLLAFEKETGKSRYSAKVSSKLSKMTEEVSKKAIDLYSNKKDFAAAAKSFYLTYKLSPKDTVYAYNAAVSATQAKKYDDALKYYQELQKVGYTGIETQYLATNKVSGQVENLGSKKNQGFLVKMGKYIKPETKVIESKKASIVKNIAFLLKEQGKTDEAIAAIKEARKSNPKDLGLILAQSELYIKLKKMDEFGKLMNEAIVLDPKNPELYYNLGVVNANQNRIEQAKKYYQKAIELKPDYADAYLNMTATLLKEDESIVEDMNKNMSNNKKYTELENKRKALYKKILPFAEKADKFKRTKDTVRIVMNIYELLEMESKSTEYRAIYKSMK